jgi:hydrogenase expression/formation protein HypC
MCLGIPGRVVRLLDGYGGQLALVDVEGAERKINIGLLDDVPLAPGDWILIHMGMAMEKVEQSQADDARAGLELLGRGTEERWS